MKIVQFVFSFLFVRNWHTGQMELSRHRLILFGGMVGIILLGVIIGYFLQTPIEYAK